MHSRTACCLLPVVLDVSLDCPLLPIPLSALSDRFVEIGQSFTHALSPEASMVETQLLTAVVSSPTLALEHGSESRTTNAILNNTSPTTNAFLNNTSGLLARVPTPSFANLQGPERPSFQAGHGHPSVQRTSPAPKSFKPVTRSQHAPSRSSSSSSATAHTRSSANPIFSPVSALPSSPPLLLTNMTPRTGLPVIGRRPSSSSQSLAVQDAVQTTTPRRR